MNQALKWTSDEIAKEIKSTLEKAAEPVRLEAQSLAFSQIDNMIHSPQWAQMRIGSTIDTIYVAPVQRGISSGRSRAKTPRGKARAAARLSHKRPRLADDLNRKVMQPARVAL